MTTLNTHKKGQQRFTIASVGAIAIALLTVAVIIGLNQTILEKIKDTSIVVDQTAVTADNDSLTWLGNNTPLDTVQINILGVTLYNNGTLVNKGEGDNANYTVQSGSITIINTSGGDGESEPVGGPKGINGSDWITGALNASYSYKFGSNSFNITTFGKDGQSQLVQFIPTIAIVAIAAVLLSIIIFFFARKIPKIEGQ